MKVESLTDFLFIGVVIIPGTLAWLDQIGLALLAFVVLLIAACLCGWYEQVLAAESEDARSMSEDSAQRPPLSTGHAMQRRDTPSSDSSKSKTPPSAGQ